MPEQMTKEEFLKSCQNFPSTRNKAKQNRPIGVDQQGKFRELDFMKGGTKGERQNTTGCYGIRGGGQIRVKMYGPQTGRRNDKKPKKVARTASNRQILLSDRRRVDKLVLLRSQLLTLQTIGDFSGKPLLDEKMRAAFSKISEEIRTLLNQDELIHMYDQERHRESSLTGRLEAEGIRVVKLRKIANQVNHQINQISPKSR